MIQFSLCPGYCYPRPGCWTSEGLVSDAWRSLLPLQLADVFWCWFGWNWRSYPRQNALGDESLHFAKFQGVHWSWEKVNILNPYNHRKIERFSPECRKNKSKVIPLTNDNLHQQRNEPIRIRSNYMRPAPSAGKARVCVSNGFGFVSLVEGV